MYLAQVGTGKKCCEAREMSESMWGQQDISGKISSLGRGFGENLQTVQNAGPQRIGGNSLKGEIRELSAPMFQ